MIYFIGAGPGDPELITVKAAEIMRTCSVAVYAGSLVNPEVLNYMPENAEIHNSASMTFGQVTSVFADANRRGLHVARVHTGDPSVYGALQEQTDWLSQRRIGFRIIPGVSSVFAAAAALGQELTLPGVSQSIVLTRLEGRTPMPAGESLEDLARHRATLVIFLSVHMIRELVGKIVASYSPTTPVVVVYRASWPDEQIVQGTLADIAEKVEARGITKTALIFVGDVLNRTYERSRLYDDGFSHGYRDAKTT